MESWNSVILISLIVFFSSTSNAGNWKVHASDLRAAIAEIEQKETLIQGLIDQKNKATGKTNTTQIIKQIVEEHKELKEAVKKYNKLRNHVRFEHPAQGDDTERRYNPKRVKSLDEFEDAVGIYGKLDRAKRKMKRTYGVEDKQPPKPPKKKKRKEDLDTEVPRVKLSY